MRYSLCTLVILLSLGPPILSTVIATIDAARVCEANSRPVYVHEPKPAAFPCLYVTPRIIISGEEEEESLL
jgi:hypothetical protein